MSGKFQPGSDQRRNTAGRAPSGRTLSSLIRQTIGRDAPQIIETLRMLSRSGDAQATVAAAVLLAAAATSK